MNCLTALQASQYTGTFNESETPDLAAARRQTLRTCQRLEQEANRLRALAAKEKQMARQVDLNLALQRISTELASARKQL